MSTDYETGQDAREEQGGLKRELWEGKSSPVL